MPPINARFQAATLDSTFECARKTYTFRGSRHQVLHGRRQTFPEGFETLVRKPSPELEFPIKFRTPNIALPAPHRRPSRLRGGLRHPNVRTHWRHRGSALPTSDSGRLREIVTRAYIVDHPETIGPLRGCCHPHSINTTRKQPYQLHRPHPDYAHNHKARQQPPSPSPCPPAVARLERDRPPKLWAWLCAVLQHVSCKKEGWLSISYNSSTPQHRCRLPALLFISFSRGSITERIFWWQRLFSPITDWLIS